jgi:hypothetical protein
VLISHPHQDHWGLVEELPAAWPIWTGAGSAKLIAVTGDVTRRSLSRTFETWDSRSGPFAVGPFTVTPILTDHSAFDAYMLLIESAGKRLLYTGDFRHHGRKSVLVDRMMAHPPADIDVLLTEGTNLGSDKPVKSESGLERDFVELFDRTRGRIFVSWSGQNIDRTVTIYRAAKRTGRTLAIDLYTADVLDRISEGTGLPRAGFPNLKVIVTRGLRSNYRSQGREDFIERMVPNGISAKRLEGSRYVVMMRSTSQCGAVICPTHIMRNRSNGVVQQALKSPTSIPVATPRPPICVRSRWPFDRRSSCRFTALSGTKNRTALVPSAALRMPNPSRSRDDQHRAKGSAHAHPAGGRNLLARGRCASHRSFDLGQCGALWRLHYLYGRPL